MAFLATLATTGLGALATMGGVVLGGIVTRRGQDRHWLRDRQLAAYEELLRHYAKFTIEIKSGNAEHRGWDYDWGEWSAALTRASLVASHDVAVEIDSFGKAIDGFLDRVARRDSTRNPVSSQEFEEASLAPAQAQLALVNAIRRSTVGKQKPLTVWIGGSHARPDSWD